MFTYVSNTSKYFDKTRPALMSRYEVLNEGSDNQVFIIGDSHAENIMMRFKQLYQESVENNQTVKFPTVLGLIQRVYPFLPCNPSYNFTIKMIYQQKPKRLLFINRWPLYMQYTY